MSDMTSIPASNYFSRILADSCRPLPNIDGDSEGMAQWEFDGEISVSQIIEQQPDDLGLDKRHPDNLENVSNDSDTNKNPKDNNAINPERGDHKNPQSLETKPDSLLMGKTGVPHSYNHNGQSRQPDKSTSTIQMTTSKYDNQLPGMEHSGQQARTEEADVGWDEGRTAVSDAQAVPRKGDNRDTSPGADKKSNLQPLKDLKSTEQSRRHRRHPDSNPGQSVLVATEPDLHPSEFRKSGPSDNHREADSAQVSSALSADNAYSKVVDRDHLSRTTAVPERNTYSFGNPQTPQLKVNDNPTLHIGDVRIRVIDDTQVAKAEGAGTRGSGKRSGAASTGRPNTADESAVSIAESRAFLRTL